MNDISVIITCHNDIPLYWDKIKQNFKPLAESKSLNFEVIIATNNKDGFFESIIQSKDPHYKVVYVPENKNEFLEIEYGIKESNGKYICFMDSDDYFYEGKLEKIFSLFESDENLVYICNSVSGIKNKFLTMDFNMSSISVRRSILIPEYFGKITMMPDTLAYYMAKNTNGKMIILKEFLNFYNISQTSASRRNRNEFLDKSEYSLNLMADWFPKLKNEINGRIFVVNIWKNEKMKLSRKFLNLWRGDYFSFKKKLEYSLAFIKRLLGNTK